MPGEHKGFRVLVVDDEAVIADTLALILRHWGFEVDVAYSGETAVQTASQHCPNALISDVVMGEMSGVDAAIEICRQNPECRVILISGQALTADLLVRARERGHVFELLTKPVHPDSLLQRLRPQA